MKHKNTIVKNKNKQRHKDILELHDSCNNTKYLCCCPCLR